MDKKDLISSHRSNVYDNFLMHWKYIKREKVGDKWKYTYKDDAVDKARTNLGKSVIDYKKAVATENKLNKDKTKADELLTTSSLNKSDAKVNAQLATSAAKRAVEKARKEYDAAKAKSDASIGNRITKALNGEKSTKDAKDKGVVEKQLSNGVTYTVPYSEKLDGPIKEDASPTKTKASDDSIKIISNMTGMKESSVKELQKLGQTDGYDSAKFKDLANDLAEGDEDTYKKIVNIIKDSNKTKTTSNKTEPKVSNEYKEELEYNSKKNVYPNGIKPQDTKKTYTKLEDILGKDERDALLEAESKKKAADEKFKKANESNEYSKYIGYDKNTGDMIKIPGYDEAVNERDDAMKKADAERKEASKEVRDTLDAFFKTPYGKLYFAELSIDEGRDYVGRKLEKLAKKLQTPNANLYKY